MAALHCYVSAGIVPDETATRLIDSFVKLCESLKVLSPDLCITSCKFVRRRLNALPPYRYDPVDMYIQVRYPTRCDITSDHYDSSELYIHSVLSRFPRESDVENTFVFIYYPKVSSNAKCFSEFITLDEHDSIEKMNKYVSTMVDDALRLI